MSDLRKFFAKEMDEEIEKIRVDYERQIAELHTEILRLKGMTHTIGITGSTGPIGIKPQAIWNSKYQWVDKGEAPKQHDSQKALLDAWEKTFNKK